MSRKKLYNIIFHFLPNCPSGILTKNTFKIIKTHIRKEAINNVPILANLTCIFIKNTKSANVILRN